MDRVQQRGSCNSGLSSSRGCLSNLKCKCGTDAVVRTVKNGPNSGMKFYGCHSWPDADCGFFKWIGGVREIGDELRFQLFEWKPQLLNWKCRSRWLKRRLRSCN
uniref:GRF-type domain-containing protein n=1 Tax=Chenopodium quinoa TaxID=63459 RepID=A0A803LQ22_CHEQI